MEQWSQGLPFGSNVQAFSFDFESKTASAIASAMLNFS